MSDLRFAAVLTVACALSGAALQDVAESPPGQTAGNDRAAQAAQRGQWLAATTCASCHAIGPHGASPMAEATPFREIVHRYPLDHLEEGFAEGLVTTHPAMPPFAFRASEIDDLIAYLETLKADEP